VYSIHNIELKNLTINNTTVR